MLQDLFNDVKFSVRLLKKDPGFTMAAVILLAAAVGASTAIFSVVNPILVRPLPFERPNRLVSIKHTHPQWGDDLTVSLPTFLDWRKGNPVFEEVAAYAEKPVLIESKIASERVWSAATSWGLLRTLGSKPHLGRLFMPSDDEPGAAPAVLLSAGLWKRTFGADPSAPGKTLRLDGRTCVIVGVMPEGFRFPLRPAGEPVELWTSLTEDPAVLGRDAIFLHVVGRLKEGITIPQAQSAMAVLMNSINRENPCDDDFGVRVAALGESETGDIQAPLAVFAAAVALLLLAACINLSGLILARSTGRRSELAIRNALGATRWRLVRQLVTEFLTLSMLGGGLGLILAYWGLEAMGHAIPERFLISDTILLNADSLWFALAISFLSGLLTAAIPAWPASRPALTEALARQGRGSENSAGARGLGRWLVVAEVALAVVLAAGAGLLIKSFWMLVGVPRGFDARNAVTARIWLPEDRYSESEAQQGFYRRLGERFAGFPGVDRLGAVQSPPLGEDLWQTYLSVEGQDFPEGAAPVSDFRVVWGDYFEALGIRLLRGRGFSPGDDAAAPPVAIVNRALASKLWPNEDALGRRLRAVGSEGPGDWATVVGVVENVAGAGFRKKPRSAIYRPLYQFSTPNMVLVARTVGDSEEVAAALIEGVAELDGRVPALRVRRMEDLVSASLAEDWYGMLLLGGFAAMALLLGLVGAYGITSFAVGQSRQEIGVRMAFGAQPEEIVRLFLRRGVVFAGAGLAIGLSMAFLFAGAMRSLLYGVTPRDPAIFAAVALLTATAVLAACYLPSRRAARLDPVKALRSL